MITACPRCEARYRVDEARIGPNGARLRCARCEAIFRIRAPSFPEPVAAPAALAAAPPTPPQRPVAERPPPNQELPSGGRAVAQPNYDRERLVLVADPKPEVGKETVSRLGEWGLETILVHDGVEAMLAIQRFLPPVVILDAALPKMYGFQICEVMKRNESLSVIKVVLVGAIHRSERYHRPPSDLYGADVYLEAPDLPDGLADTLEQFGLPLGNRPAPRGGASAQEERESVVPTPRPEPVGQSTPAPAASPSVVPAANDGLDEERAKAARLARVIVSDIVLYKEEKFDQAIRDGNLLEILDSDLEEGRNFFRQRIDERIRAEKDYLVEELQRVAGERGAR